MPVNILMPALSPTMEKGNLAKWFKKEGDKVKPGDVIAEIETDKATMEYEAIDEGTLAKIVVPEGTQDVPVKALTAVLAEEGEDVKAAAASAGKGAPALKPAPPKPAAAAPPPPSTGAAASARPAPAPPPAAKPSEAPRAAAQATQAPAARRRAGEGNGVARPHQPRVFVAAGAPASERGRHRPCAHPRLRPARPRDRARRGSGEVEPRPCRAGRGAGGGVSRPSARRREDRRPVRARLVRGRLARQCPQGDRAAPPRSEAHHPAFLSHARVQYR